MVKGLLSLGSMPCRSVLAYGRAPIPAGPPRWTRQFLARYSTETEAAVTTPPLLQKLRGELKNAMRAKDAPRLSVLRAIMSANLNASKTTNPITTDVQLVSLIRRIQNETKESLQEAENAGREDLKEKSQAEITVLESMVADSGVQNVTLEELQELVKDIVSAAANEGQSTMKTTMDKAKKALEGKVFDRKALAEAAKQALRN